MSASEIIRKLELAPHPEGGWYRETWAAPAADRAHATAILFLLQDGERSHWHRVDADEVWLWHAGAPLTLLRAETDAGPAEAIALGPDVLGGEAPQSVIPAGWWQAAATTGAYSLVSCVVAPGFRFEGFELAAPAFDIPSA